ncbi:MAG TPA: MBL fold metallo-hydrolase [Planctomycetes bacterium]|nr:MBL fold metallo-hydrolase [Planctomycetota bacterium]
MHPCPIDLGGVSVLPLRGGAFRLDAGAMFGMVPKVLWQQHVSIDENNRTALACNVPLVRIGGSVLVIDTGCGDKWDAKSREMYAMEGGSLCDALRACGVSPEDVTHVVLTHLHFDHAGGLTRWADASDAGCPVLNYPRAVFFVQKAEWDAALKPSELTRRTYLRENLEPLASSGRLRILDGGAAVLPGVSVLLTGGHSPGHQAVRIEGAERVMYHPGDLLPLSHHSRPAWIPAYDCDASVSLEAKKSLFARAAEEDAIVWTAHDPAAPAVSLALADGGRGFCCAAVPLERQ